MINKEVYYLIFNQIAAIINNAAFQQITKYTVKILLALHQIWGKVVVKEWVYQQNKKLMETKHLINFKVVNQKIYLYIKGKNQTGI